MPVFTEVHGDLFKCSEVNSLAHCVSQDMHMGKGIALFFKKIFGGCDDLRAQGAKVGDVAVLTRENRYIYYLVTKLKYSDKPTYADLESSLRKMKDHCLKNNVKHLAMPKIGCGLDRLQWTKVRDLIKTIFLDTDIIISIYVL
uniref:Macro domain-containing protein n=1 Tax=Arion vulgaris TaxID=1028688 RepID=A0A0B7A2D5_9EUPU